MEYTRKIRRFMEVVPKRMYSKCDNTTFQGGYADHARETILKDTPDTMTVFNSLSWNRKVFATLPEGSLLN